MKTLVATVIIDMGMVHKPSKQVWAWEVPVLEAKFGEGKVRLLEEVEVEVESIPDPKDEFSRLSRAHGIDSGDGGTNQTYCELAYGRGKAAVTELSKQMKRKLRKAKKTTKATPKPKPEPEADGDPLGLD